MAQRTVKHQPTTRAGKMGKQGRVPSRKRLAITAVCSTIISLILLCGICAYLLIMAGWSQKLQTTWVCSAMNTFHHKYLATWFIPTKTIDRILEENMARDDGTDTDQSAINPQGGQSQLEQATEDNQVDPYLEEGYEKLEDGVYLKEVEGSSYRGYVMLVSDPTRVKLVDTANQFSCGQTVMQMSERVGAVAAINGGGFNDGPNYDSNGGSPSGIIIEDGKLVNPSRPSANDYYNIIGMTSNGIFTLQHGSSQWAVDHDIYSAISFSPFLVVNGVGQINGSGGWGIAPRTALGQRATGEMLFLVIDGRQVGWSIGCDLDVLQNTLLDEGCVNAAMLDGGSSTVMIYRGEFVNRPALGFERYINNCWVVMPAGEETSVES